MDQYFSDYNPLLNDNYIINGNFDVWQRGTSQTTSGYLSDDRWYNGGYGSSTKTHTQQAFTTGQTDVPNSPRYFSRTVVVTGGGAADRIVKIQKIEGVRQLSNKTVTFSFWAKADTDREIAVSFVQDFGTGGSPSTSVGITGYKYSISSSWRKIVGTINIPSIYGQTIGTDENASLALTIWFDAGSNYSSVTNSLGNQSGTFDIAQVKLEEGNVATQFIPRSSGLELSLCYRFYENLYFSYVPMIIPYTGTGYTYVYYKQKKRGANATVTFYGSAYDFYLNTATSTWVNPSNKTASDMNAGALISYTTTITTGNFPVLIKGGITIDSEL